MVKDNLHVPVLRDPSYDLIVDIPGGLQLDVKGKNKLDRDITNGFILKYTNRCGVVLFTPGYSIGWLSFVSLFFFLFFSFNLFYY